MFRHGDFSTLKIHHSDFMVCANRFGPDVHLSHDVCTVIHPAHHDGDFEILRILFKTDPHALQFFSHHIFDKSRHEFFSIETGTIRVLIAIPEFYCSHDAAALQIDIKMSKVVPLQKSKRTWITYLQYLPNMIRQKRMIVSSHDPK